MTRSVGIATPLDAFALRRMPFSPVGGPLGPLESQCVASPSPLLLALSGCGGRQRILVARRGRRLEGALHVTAHSHARRWEIVQTSGQPEDSDWLPELLQAATVAAAAAGVERLIARIGHDDVRLAHFEMSGFRPYAQETIFGQEVMLPAAIECSYNVRPYSRRDEWKLQRLYANMTPQNVGHMELMTPRDFAQPFSGRGGLVVEGAGEILAACGYLPRSPREAALLRLLVRVDAVAAAQAALVAVFGRLATRNVRQALLPVRDYMADCLAAARLAGMAPLMTRAVLVKHTAALVRPPVFGRLREVPSALPAVNGTRLVHNGCHAPQCRLRNEIRPRRREAPVSVA